MFGWRERLVPVGILWLRLWVGLALMSHGYGKIFGGGMEGFAQFAVAQKLGFPLPSFFAWMAALSEFLGGLLLAVGLGTRVAAAFVFINMSVAFFIYHAADPFRVKELAFLYWAVAGGLILVGPHRHSLDCRILRRLRGPDLNSGA
ncbi:MAG: DoxX family protein [Elusimicrobia bacterium]|nr:DoxX family protein [Elusimicrobiota bacterium]